MKVKFCLIITLIIYLFLSCHKDKTSNNCNCNHPADFCTDNYFPNIDLSQPHIDYMFYYDTNYVKWTYFNPNNVNEIIYCKDVGFRSTQIIKFNLSNKQKQILHTGFLLSPPKWGRKHWILLTHGAQIWKIKDNGDSLTQLTFTYANYNPEWNYAGDKFITEFTGYSSNTYSRIYDLNGQVTDSLPYFLYGEVWQNDSLMIYPGIQTYTIGVTNILNKSSYTLYNDGIIKDDMILSVYWLPDFNEIVFTSPKGIYKYNIQTNKITCLKLKCKNDMYLNPCIFYPGNKIMFYKEHQKYMGNMEVLISSKIVLLNLDGSGEQEIKLQ